MSSTATLANYKVCSDSDDSENADNLFQRHLTAKKRNTSSNQHQPSPRHGKSKHKNIIDEDDSDESDSSSDDNTETNNKLKKQYTANYTNKQKKYSSDKSKKPRIEINDESLSTSENEDSGALDPVSQQLADLLKSSTLESAFTRYQIQVSAFEMLYHTLFSHRIDNLDNFEEFVGNTFKIVEIFTTHAANSPKSILTSEEIVWVNMFIHNFKADLIHGIELNSQLMRLGSMNNNSTGGCLVESKITQYAKLFSNPDIMNILNNTATLNNSDANESREEMLNKENIPSPSAQMAISIATETTNLKFHNMKFEEFKLYAKKWFNETVRSHSQYSEKLRSIFMLLCICNSFKRINLPYEAVVDKVTISQNDAKDGMPGSSVYKVRFNKPVLVLHTIRVTGEYHMTKLCSDTTENLFRIHLYNKGAARPDSFISPINNKTSSYYYANGPTFVSKKFSAEEHVDMNFFSLVSECKSANQIRKGQQNKQYVNRVVTLYFLDLTLGPSTPPSKSRGIRLYIDPSCCGETDHRVE